MTKGLNSINCTWRVVQKLQPGWRQDIWLWGKRMLVLELKCPFILKGCPGSLGYWLDKKIFLWLYSTNLKTKTKT